MYGQQNTKFTELISHIFLLFRRLTDSRSSLMNFNHCDRSKQCYCFCDRWKLYWTSLTTSL